jgi:hypothetical protein
MSDLKTYGELIEKRYHINTFSFAGRMRKSGCSEDYILQVFEILSKSSDYDPWKFMGGKIRMNKINLKEAEVKKAHKDSMESLASIKKMMLGEKQ